MLRLSRKKPWILFISLIFFTYSGLLLAQEELAEKEYLNLKECINIALQNGTKMKNALNTYEAADVDVLGSYSHILPTLSASAGNGQIDTGPSEYLSNEPVGIDPVTGNVIYEQRTRIIEKQHRQSSTANITLNQNIFDGGIWWNQIRKAKADRRSSDLNFKSERDNTILDVQRAYYDLNKQVKLLGANSMAVERSKAQLNRTEKMYELGATARLDVFRAKVNLGNDRINMLQQKNIVEQAMKTLNIVMGRDPLVPIGIEAVQGPAVSLPEIDELILQAIENQPLIKKYEEEITSNRLSINMAKGINFPRLSAYVQYNRFHEDLIKVFSDFDKNYQTQYGLNLSVNLFNGFSDYTNIEKAEINKRITETTFDEYKRNLKSAIHQYYSDYTATLEIIEINEQNLEAAKEEVRLSEERYQIGAGTSLEVRESQLNLTNAEQTLIAAQYAALILLADMDNKRGIAYKKFSGE